MAKNYTFAEVVRIVNAGTDMEAIMEIGKRFPGLLHKVTKVVTKAGEDFVELANFLPEHLTANKVNTAIKNSIVSSESDSEEVETEGESTEKEAVKEVAKKEKVEKTADDFESMSGKELWDLLGKAGKRKDCKEKMGGAKKDHMVAYIKKYGLETEVVEEEPVMEIEETENPYVGISAMELFKECKKRGIKAAAKKPAKYYIELLMKSDEEVAEAPVTDEADDWGEEVVEEAEVKEEAKPKKEKKATKEEEVDDDDDWDI